MDFRYVYQDFKVDRHNDYILKGESGGIPCPSIGGNTFTNVEF